MYMFFFEMVWQETYGTTWRAALTSFISRSGMTPSKLVRFRELVRCPRGSRCPIIEDLRLIEHVCYGFWDLIYALWALLVLIVTFPRKVRCTHRTRKVECIQDILPVHLLSLGLPEGFCTFRSTRQGADRDRHSSLCRLL